MRVLIISTLLACAAAAPSNLIAPLTPFSPVGIKAVPIPAIIPAVIPTLSPGDIQAAAIDAKVQAEDYARSVADKAREIAEQANENLSEKAISTKDLVKNKNLETLWSIENQQWQALDELKIAQAKLDGVVASNADLLAKAAIGGVYRPYIAAIGPVGPVVSPLSPIIYTTPIVAPDLQGISSQTLVRAEEAKSEGEKAEAAVKTAEPAGEKVMETGVESKSDTVAIESVNSAVPEKSVLGLVDARFPFLPVAPVASLASLSLTQPAVAYSSTIQHGPVLSASFAKSGW